jgi:hypothetical protein
MNYNLLISRQPTHSLDIYDSLASKWNLLILTPPFASLDRQSTHLVSGTPTHIEHIQNFHSFSIKAST